MSLVITCTPAVLNEAGSVYRPCVCKSVYLCTKKEKLLIGKYRNDVGICFMVNPIND